MKFKLHLMFLILLLFNTNLITAQVSYVKNEHTVYKYLSILSQKGIIDYDELVKPLSRRYIAQKLIEAKENFSKLTKLQKDELAFYEAEFGYEVEREKAGISNQKSVISDQMEEGRSKELGVRSKEQGEGRTESGEKKEKRDLFDKSWEFEVRTSENVKTKEVETENGEEEKERFTFVKKDPYKRWRFFSYKNEIMYLNVNPIIGLETGNWNKLHYNNLFAGAAFNGELGNVLGYSFEFYQTRQTPGYINFLYYGFTPKTYDRVFIADSERREYPSMNMNLGYSWDWGSISLGKNQINWGYAENGKIVLSSKAPAYPNIRLDIKPTEWLSFHYMHGWLNSDVIDSNAFYSSWRVYEYDNTDRIVYIPKYIVMHSFTLTPIKNLDFSFGESVVYADRLQIGYLIPFMFFDMMDEYLGRSDNYAGGSTQLFLSLSSKNHLPNTHLYGTFHADELTPDGLFDPKTQYYKFAFTFGGYTIDMPINNLGIRMEYTKVYPGNYRHFIPSLTYESSSALLGHWIGDNGDLIYGAVDYTFFRGLDIKIWVQYIRKGTEALGNRAYKEQIPQPGFLFTDNISDRKNYLYYGINVNYEIFHDLWLEAHYQYIDFEQQYEKDKYNSTLNRDFSLVLGYGI